MKMDETEDPKPGAESNGAERAAQFHDIYRREKPRLLRYFFMKTRNRAEADDMAQEAMTRFLKAAPVTAISTPQAYLTRIATNLLRDHSERGSTRLARLAVPLDEAFEQAGGIDAHREVASRQELEKWKAILLQLPSRTLEIFLLNRVEGISYREIATNLSLPLWMVQKHMLKAIRHIAAHQDGEYD